MAEHLVILRYLDSMDASMVAICRPPEAAKLLGDVCDDPDWLPITDKPCVMIDTNSVVCVTSADELKAIAYWFNKAAKWLRDRERAGE